MKKLLIFSLIIFLSFCAGGPSESEDNSALVNSSPSLQTQPGQEVHAEEHDHEVLHVSPEQQKAWLISLGQPQLEPFQKIITLPGIVSLNQNQTAQITPFVSGKVAELKTDLGQEVRQGETLIVLNSPEFARAQANFLQARANLLLSQKEYERAQKLLASQAIEEKEFLRRKAEHEKIVTEYGVLESILHSYGITPAYLEALIAKGDALSQKGDFYQIANPLLPLLSPINGTVIFRDVITGEQVNPDKVLLTIANLSSLWVILDAYEKDLPYLKEKSSVAISSTLYPNQIFHGRIETINAIIDEKLRTVKVRVVVPNSKRLLKPNMFVQGQIIWQDPNQKVLTLPEEAVQSLNDEKIVFVAGAEDKFSIKHIKIGEVIGQRRIILSGLSGDELVVIKGAHTLKTELTKGTTGHAHVH